ncbi:1,4-dihydroxy-2-naphthoyl-CoA hydrolase [Falsiruegeria mediterranea M17]|uniref:1,4-dihydroxy-2-naphthoyl-CoA hydrolase n=2 Tax=Falsiruegeria TaxID=2854184 RepID=A0A2R8CD68_9RHOB|nr:1,4-dihydroxy-2-naphthoyl-CoA hydrolase [Falsiruegeria mediterranea M17]
MKTRISESFAEQGMMTTLNAQLDGIEKGRVEISAPIVPEFAQQQGHAHAALSFALGDTAAGYAALTCAPPDHEVVTAEIKINMLAPGRGDRLKAIGRVLKPGRRLIVVAADVYAISDGTETHVAALQGTIVPVPV